MDDFTTQQYYYVKKGLDSGFLSREAAFISAQELLSETPGFQKIGYGKNIDQVLSRLDEPMKRIDHFGKLPRPARQSPMDALKAAATEYDGPHSNPKQEELRRIIVGVEETKANGDYDISSGREATRRHDFVMEEEVKKRQERQSTRDAETHEHVQTVLKGFKDQIVKGFFSERQDGWPSDLKYSCDWISRNIEGGAEIADAVRDVTSDLSNVGVLMSYGNTTLDEVADIKTRSCQMQQPSGGPEL